MKRDKVLNIVIYTLIAFIIIVSGIIVYLHYFIDEHDISFNLNGASSLEKNKITCTKNLFGCYVIMPKATRESGEVLGYSKYLDDNKATYKVGEKVYIKEDLVLYTISYAKYNVHINDENVDYLEDNNVFCNAYNVNTSCSVKLPLFNKLGYQVAGYGLTSNENVKTPSQYYPNETYLLNSDLTLYPKYSEDRRGDNVIYSTNLLTYINGSIIEAEDSIPKNISNLYIDFFKEIKEKAPFLFTNQKISLINGTTFTKVWGKNVIGICYGSTIEGHPLSRSIDIYYDFDENQNDKYETLVHEMAHAWDFYYPYKLTGKVGDVSDLDKSFNNTTAAFNKVFGTDRISAQKDIIDLYNKYIDLPKNSRPFNDYAFSSHTEFVAEIVAYYYLKYLVPTDGYKNAYYPEDVKKIVEKYMCIANNNYNVNACS